MAAGLGTRMKSATPKHLHPLLGRRHGRLGDRGRARALGADPLVVVASPETPRRVRGDRRRRPGASRSAPATRCARPARALDGATATCSSLSGDRPLLTPELLRDLLDDAPAASAPPRRCSRSSRRTRAQYGRIVRDGDGRLARIVESGRRDARRARAPRGQLLDLRLRARTSSGPRSSGSSRRTRRASSTSPTRSASSSQDGEPVARARRRRSARRRGREHARRAGRRRGCAARPHQRGAHARRRDDRRPADDLDRRRRRDRGRRRPIHPFTVIRGGREDRGRRRGRPARRRVDAEIGPAHRRPVRLPSPGHQLEAARRPARSWRSRTRASARARRSRTSRTSATPTSARTRTSPPATSPPTSSTSPASGEGADADRAERQDRHSTIRSLPRSRSATTLGLRAGAVITEDVPPGSLAGFPPKQTRKEGYAAWKAQRLS